MSSGVETTLHSTSKRSSASPFDKGTNDVNAPGAYRGKTSAATGRESLLAGSHSADGGMYVTCLPSPRRWTSSVRNIGNVSAKASMPVDLMQIASGTGNTLNVLSSNSATSSEKYWKPAWTSDAVSVDLPLPGAAGRR